MAEFTLEQQKAIAIANARIRAENKYSGIGGQDAFNARLQDMEQRDAQLSEQKKIAEENKRAFERRQAWQAISQTGDKEMAARAIVSEFAEKGLDMLKSAGPEGLAIGLGQVVGRRVAGTPGAATGGAIAGAAENTAAQMYDVAMGEKSTINPGEIISTAISGAITTQGAKRNAAANAAAETVRSLIDERRLPDIERVSQAAAMGYIAGKVSQNISGKELKPLDALMEYRYDTFRNLRQEGVVVNPAYFERNRVLTAVAGEQFLDVSASKQNQYVWQKMAREELGLPKRALPFRRDQIDGSGNVVKGEISEFIERQRKVYEEVGEISNVVDGELSNFNKGKPLPSWLRNKTQKEFDAMLSAKANLDELWNVRKQIKTASADIKANKNVPENNALLEQLKRREMELDSSLEFAATAFGKPKLLERLKSARTNYAKAAALRFATNDVTGLVDINTLADMRQTSARPGFQLTGNLAKMADFAEAFGPNAVEAVAAGVGRPTGVAVNYAARQTAMGQKSGAISGAVPYLSKGAKRASLSKWIQESLAKPQYDYRAPVPKSDVVRAMIMAAGREPAVFSYKITEDQPDSQ